MSQIWSYFDLVYIFTKGHMLNNYNDNITTAKTAGTNSGSMVCKLLKSIKTEKSSWIKQYVLVWINFLEQKLHWYWSDNALCDSYNWKSK